MYMATQYTHCMVIICTTTIIHLSHACTHKIIIITAHKSELLSCILQLVLSLTSRLLDIAQNNFKGGISVSINLLATTNSDMHSYYYCLQLSEDFIAGSTLLRILEDFALNNHDAIHSLVQNDNISKMVYLDP